MELLITAKITTTSESLKQYSPGERGCFLPGEKELGIFKIYTQQNCYTECLVKSIIENCKCIPFYFPSEHSKKSY